MCKSLSSKQFVKCFCTWLHVAMHNTGVILGTDASMMRSKCWSLYSVCVSPGGGGSVSKACIEFFNSFLISDFTTLQHSSIGFNGALQGAFSLTTTTSSIGDVTLRRTVLIQSLQSGFLYDPHSSPALPIHQSSLSNCTYDVDILSFWGWSFHTASSSFSRSSNSSP